MKFSAPASLLAATVRGIAGGRDDCVPRSLSCWLAFHQTTDGTRLLESALGLRV
jgi:hypothetical protein